MTLPLSRNTTYAPSAQVKSADLNDIQDQIVTLHSRAIRAVNISPAIGFSRHDLQSAEVSSQSGAVGSIGAGGDSFWTVPLDLREGDVVDKIEVRGLEPDGGGEAFILQLFETVLGTSTQQIGDTITSGTTNAEVTYTWDDTTNDSVNEIPYTVVANGRLELQIQFSQTTADSESQILNVRVEIQ